MVLSKGWRVENDKVIIRVDILQILHSVARNSLVLSLVAKVKAHILVGKLDSTLREVDRYHLTSTSRQRSNREATSIAECVEHLTASRVLAHQVTVYTLVYKKARFLTLLPVNLKLQAILQHHSIGILRAAP